MKLRFSKTSPPEFVEYRGHKYRLKKAAIPARQADQKLDQVARAMSRIEQQGYNAELLPALKRDWSIDTENLMASEGRRHGTTPHFVMWNPLTNELLLAEEEDFSLHKDLYAAHENNVVSYPSAQYEDWARGFIKSDRVATDDGYTWKDALIYWKWTPLHRDHLYYLSGSQRREAERLTSKSRGIFKKLMDALGTGDMVVKPL